MIYAAGLILAAGLASRMGGDKPLRRISDRTLLECAVLSLQPFCPAGVYVVVGHAAAAVAAEARRAGAIAVHNPDFEHGMLSSILTGVRALPDCVQAFFLLPVDCPFVRPETLALLAARFATLDRDGRVLAVRPTHAGRGGHPPLISISILAELERFAKAGGAGGLKALLRGRTLDAPLDDPAVLDDFDRPEDLPVQA